MVEEKGYVYQAHGTVKNPLAVREYIHQELTLVGPVLQGLKSQPQPVRQYYRTPIYREGLLCSFLWSISK